MTKHQRMLLPGASHCLWCGVVLGLLAADIYSNISWSFFRGLVVASVFSVLLLMVASYREHISWTYIWGAMLLPPLAALLLCHVCWLVYNFIFWIWDYDFALFIREAVLPVVSLCGEHVTS